jgi:hypothetical protein
MPPNLTVEMHQLQFAFIFILAEQECIESYLQEVPHISPFPNLKKTIKKPEPLANAP